MLITYPKYFTKEVHSDEFDRVLAGLESAKEKGFIYDIERDYSEDGWTLRGIMYGGFEAWVFTGKWD